MSSAPPAAPAESPLQSIGLLAARRVALNLSTPDVCFVAALHLRALGAELPSFSEEELGDVFEQVAAVVTAEIGAAKPRAAAAIRKLREQRLLIRVDGHGPSQAGEYALTRLGTSIAEFYLDEDALTRESLSVLTRSLLATLHDAREAARRGGSAAEIEAKVILPLRVTATDLLAGIQRRQRGFDLQQEEIQRRLSALIEADWFRAVDQCEALLEDTSRTLAELGSLLLQDTHEILTVLVDIQDACHERREVEAEHAAARVIEQVSRAQSWGSARQRAFGEYYERVHRFLRDVVRIDPSRTLIHRLREHLVRQVKGADRDDPLSVSRAALVVACAPPMRLLREAPPRRAKPPVIRKRQEREAPPAEAAAVDLDAELDERVRDALARGSRSLSRVALDVIGEVEAPARFLEAGRITESVARVCAPLAKAERPWVRMGDTCELEEWELGGDAVSGRQAS